MMTYVQLSPIYKMITQVVMVVILVMQIYQFMSFVSSVKNWRASIAQSVGIILNMGLLIIVSSEYQYILRYRRPSDVVLQITRIPVWLLLVLGTVVVVIMIGASLYIKKLKNNVITENSIKEGTDDIPMGICYAKKDGMTILVNRKMYKLSLEIIESALQNANHFWEQIISGKLPNGVQRIKEGDKPVLLLADGTAWTFSKQYVKMKEEEIVQLLAIDTTDLYQLSQELKEKNQSLKEMNNRLQEYSENVTEVTRDEEILAAKIKIHADMGSALLATRYYLNNPGGKEQTDALIKAWDYNISMLYNEAKTEQQEDVFVHLLAAAEAVGVTIEVNGKIPKSNVKAERLIVGAARECLTNTVRHGDGDKVIINIREDEQFYYVEYTNNGTVPTDDIKEGGGLMGLRRRIEDAGGDMKIISNPKLILMINIPKGRK